MALRYEKRRDEMTAEETEQYQLFEASQYKYRILVTDFNDPINFVFWFYNQLASAMVDDKCPAISRRLLSASS